MAAPLSHSPEEDHEPSGTRPFDRTSLEASLAEALRAVEDAGAAPDPPTTADGAQPAPDAGVSGPVEPGNTATGTPTGPARRQSRRAGAVTPVGATRRSRATANAAAAPVSDGPDATHGREAATVRDAPRLDAALAAVLAPAGRPASPPPPDPPVAGATPGSAAPAGSEDDDAEATRAPAALAAFRATAPSVPVDPFRRASQAVNHVGLRRSALRPGLGGPADDGAVTVAPGVGSPADHLAPTDHLTPADDVAPADRAAPAAPADPAGRPVAAIPSNLRLLPPPPDGPSPLDAPAAAVAEAPAPAATIRPWRPEDDDILPARRARRRRGR